ncbi:uncharacterized protein LOC128221868 [Mya arenaria]|nr:uncharacterized protein LOC128221868 [Mya arenaria]
MQRAKSAPAGRQRSRRVNALHEIEEWVLSSKNKPENDEFEDKMFSKSNDQRLLKAKLMELGKERFKVMAKLNHDKQKFVERQKRNGLLNRNIRSAATSTRASSEQRLNTLRGSQSLSAPAKRPCSAISRQKTVQFHTDFRKAEYITTGVNPNFTEEIAPTREEKDDIVETFILLQPNLSTEVPPSQLIRPFTAGNQNFSRTPSSSSLNSRGKAGKQLVNGKPPKGQWEFEGERFQRQHSKEDRINDEQQFPNVEASNDRRFYKLHKSLSNNYATRVRDDVPTIIRKIGSLQMPLKAGSKEARRELEAKIKIFMEENNIVF